LRRTALRVDFGLYLAGWPCPAVALQALGAHSGEDDRLFLRMVTTCSGP
jgi:hypothetical protein